MRYLLNSAVITAPGSYTYRRLTVDEARAWLSAGPWTSTIGYSETAAALSEVAGMNIPTDRRTIVMKPGDEALVFRLVLPPGERRTEPLSKGGLGREYILAHCEIGVLTRSY